VAVESSASLIVLGSSHVGRLGRITPGSTAERLLHGAPCALVVVPAGAREHSVPLAPIGAAFDGSPESYVALAAAVAAARALHAPLHVIGVCDVARYGAPALQYGPGYYVSADTVRDDGAVQLAAGVATIPDDVDVEKVLLFGKPARELAGASSGLGMLFVGSRGYGPLRAVVLGGVGGALVRDAACPVIFTARGAAVDTATTTAAAAATR
jgi:nucleotide-binding universal stress UspA family protein